MKSWFATRTRTHDEDEMREWRPLRRATLSEVAASNVPSDAREDLVLALDFLGAAAVGVYEVDREGRFTYANELFAKWAGCEGGALIRGPIRLHDLFPEARGEGLAANQAFATKGRGRGTAKFWAVDGAVRSVEIAHLPAADEKLTRALVRDIDATQAEAEAQRRLARRATRAFDQTPVGIAILDADGMVIECNPAFLRLLGRSPKTVVGWELLKLVAAEDVESVRAWFERASTAPEMPPPLDVRMGPGDATVASLVAWRIEQGGLSVHALDVTQTKRLEAQFLQSQKREMVGKLAGGIAHDFNNILQGMIGFCDLLLLRYSPKDPAFADIMQIKQNANRGASLVRHLLAFSRQQTLQPRVFNITDVLAELSHLLRRLIGAKIELKMVHGRDLGLVRVDQGQFEQVIINLAVNARDAMPNGGTLTIRTSNVIDDPRLRDAGVAPDAQFVAVDVIDTGCGIPKDHLEKIFEPFFTTKGVGAGTGLGLSTVYGIIKQTGGHIVVDSEVDHGATFTIMLPVHVGADEAEPATREREARRDLSGAGTVLLVEDEDAVRAFGARALRSKGYTVLEARNGEGALDILRNSGQPIDLLISDVVMPGLDGPALFNEVRELRPELKVVFISGYAEDSFRERIGNDAAVHFLPKPFTLQQLAGKVKEVMQPRA